MKKSIASHRRALLHAFYSFLIAIAVLWAMPRNACAQLYVTNGAGGGGVEVVSEYNGWRISMNRDDRIELAFLSELLEQLSNFRPKTGRQASPEILR